MRIGYAFNQRPHAVADLTTLGGDDGHALAHGDAFVEWDDPSTIDAVAEALAVFGPVVRLEATADFPANLRDAEVDLLFNMAEGLHGPSREAHVPAIAEFLGVPYTGSDPLTLALALHKGRAKEVWLQRGVPTAAYRVVESSAALGCLREWDRYPAFLKPAWEGSSKGITQANYVRGPAQAIARATELLEQYGEPVIAEAYLEGDEFTVAILGNGADAACLPLIRYRFEALPDGARPMIGFEAKWVWDTPDADFDILECPARVPAALTREIQEVALAAFHTLGCRDWARVDVRLDGAGRPHVLEVNPLPGIIPEPEAHSCFPRAAAQLGWSYQELVQRVVVVAWKRVAGTELGVPTFAGVSG